MASKIPDSFFVGEKPVVEREKMKTLMVIRGNTYNLFQDVHKPGTVISWYFETDDYDISFGVFYSTTRSKAKQSEGHEQIRELTRVNSNMVPEDGTLTCSKAGVYILRFDNSYSWVMNKTVHYELEVIEPSEDELFKDTIESVDQVTDTLESTHL